MKRLVLLSVILQEGMSFAADNGRKWQVAVVIGKNADVWMISSGGIYSPT
jgi:hypothetical protein